MEVQKRKRKQQRKEFTIAADKLQNSIDANTDIYEIDENFANMIEIADMLFQTEEKLRNLWLEQDDFDEATYEADQDKYNQYRERRVTLKTRYEKIKCDLDNSARASIKTTKNKNNSDSEDEAVGKRRFKLPKIELAKFDGNLKNWLQFWGQFKKIHDDQILDDEDKFQYLIQAMTPNSSARQLVESYPPCGMNYHKAVDALKSRFARDELLIECYVRGLQNLVLTQARGQVLDIRTLYDKLQALETLGVTKDRYAAMLLPMVESALSEEMLRVWHRNRYSIDKPNSDELNNLLMFLRKEVESEERIEIARTGINDLEVTQLKPPTMTFLATAASTSGANAGNRKTEKVNAICIWCDKPSHASSECHKAAKMSLEERIDFIKKKKGCLICLKIGHWTKKCKSFPKCLYCKKRHVTIMCSKLSKYAEETTETTTKNEEVLICKKETSTLLQTVLVELYNNEKSVKVRALIDSGAQKSFITKTVAKSIGLKPIGRETMSHGVFGGTQTKSQEHNIYAANVRSIDKRFTTQITVIEEEKICGYVPKVLNKNLICILNKRGIVLTEMTNDCPDDISLLIGADFSGSLLTGDIIQLENNLTAIKTKLGWTLQGMILGSNNTINTLFNTSKIEVTDLWSLETLGIKDPAEQNKTIEHEQQVLDSFKRTIQVNEEGRYEVHLPWRDMPRPETNYDLALKRLDSTTRRLQHLGKIETYNSVFQEWLDLHIIEQAPSSDVSGHYLAHHAVIKESSLTTKVRPVFDASAKDRYGISLNSCLEKGVNLIELIPQLLIDFRKGAIGITADIAKAFLQVSLVPEDREYLKFLWWLNPSSEDRTLVTYRHRRVVFGVTSSPFHLAATIAHHLDNCPENLQETAMKLKSSFYIDNCVTSVESAEAMNKFIAEAKEIMKRGKFDLRCWVTAPVTIDENIATISVLGVNWIIKDDNLNCNIGSLKDFEGKFTKRNILSMTQKIFDPIGVCCPTTIVPRMIIQKSWLKKLSWDKELPPDLASEFKNWLKYVSFISEIKIPRRLTNFDITKCQNSLHVFCDASVHAYATCIFLRSQNGDNVNISLVLAKSRVTPVKKITIPRLELIAAVLAVRLNKQVTNALNLKNVTTYYWTDSSVTLSWIKGCGDWGVFVSNRVREIKGSSSTDEWHHVSGHLNPADLPSRGINAKGLLESRWWEGPSWLLLDADRWPITDFTIDTEMVNSELKKGTVNTTLTTHQEHFLDRLMYFSSYIRIVRTISWILRIRSKPVLHSLELSYDEVEYAERVLIKLIQNKWVLKLQKDCKLLIFKDENGILRLKTKLELGDESMKYKYPVILPGNEPIVQRLVEERHRTLHHAGLQTLMVNIRETFWIIGLRRLSRKVINNCLRCKRYKVKSCQAPPIGLPVDRIKEGKAFEVTGIDLAGPLLLRSGEKCWIALFTCAIYRAVHLELVTSLSTETFMMALRRFIARRGRVKVIYTDNGTNFVGTHSRINSIDYDQLVIQTSIHKIKWRFIPPGAPWWGGWWERLIGVVKGLLRRILGRAALNYVELETVLCDCEAVVNQRPLTYVTGDDENLKPLTPAMFIQTLSSSDVTDLNQIDAKGLNMRLKYLQKIRDDLQQRFRNEYLSCLVQKGKIEHKRLSVGDVVLVETEGKRINWPLGLVVEMFTGVDGECRVAKIKTANGFKIRPVQKLYALEVSSTDRLSNTNIDISIPPAPSPSNNSDVADRQITTRSGRIVKFPTRFL